MPSTDPLNPISKTLYCVVDPLCGWCYGAGPALGALALQPGLELRLLPSGLFSGPGARAMDPDFAAYAWRNDQRIEQLTGQRFTERYRHAVLADRTQRFDSGPASLALSAVALSAPEQELAALKALQAARYVEGEDLTASETLLAVLRSLGLAAAAERLRGADSELIAVHRARVASAQALMRHCGAQGVPSFILERDGQRQLLPSEAAYSAPQAFAHQLAAA